jgi:hypothetical protein
MLSAFLISPMHATWSTRLILLDFITLTTFEEKNYKACHFAMFSNLTLFPSSSDSSPTRVSYMDTKILLYPLEY